MVTIMIPQIRFSDRPLRHDATVSQKGTQPFYHRRYILSEEGWTVEDVL